MFDRHFRARALAACSQPFDLVVVGGGINGCGILYDAAQRGLRTLLVERGDLAAGTSSRSSKLVHGGLRYLRQLQLHTTRLSCRERDRHLRLDPDLVMAQPFLYPARRGERIKGWQIELGLDLYDRLTRGERHRRIDVAAAHALAPDLDLTGLDRALVYRDARVDDARLVFAVAASALAAGGFVLTRAAAVAGRGDGGERLRRLVIADQEDGRTHEVEAAVVVNATGVWTDELRASCGLGGRRLRPSRGSHLLLAPGTLRLDTAVSFAAADGRPVFVVPHPEGALVGTTDVFHEGDLADPRPSKAEVDYLLAAIQDRFPAARLDFAKVSGTFAGLRPILDDHARTPAEASRDEAIWEERGLITVAGGKLTTWRSTAERAVDAALALLPPERRTRALPAATAGAPLAGRSPLDLPEQLATAAPLAAPIAAALARRLRGLAWLALDLARSPRELAPLRDDTDLTLAEVRVHLRHGAVVHLDDLLLRRTRLGMWTPELAAALAPQLRTVCAEELGWSAARFDAEVATLDGALVGWQVSGVR